MMSSKTVFFNGRVFKFDYQTSRAEICDALVTDGSKIVHVGRNSDDTVRAAKQSGAVAVDLANRVLLPGFIDAHVHLLQFGHSLEKLDLFGCQSLAAIQVAITQFAKSHPLARRILCHNWLQANTGGKALASMLDGLDPNNRPVYVEACDLHSTWCSTSAMAELPMAEILKTCPGDVQCDTSGNPTGLLSERANLSYVSPFLAKSYTTDEKQNALKLAFAAYTQAGYTGAVDMLMDDNAWEALQKYRKDNGSLPLHMGVHWFCPYHENRETLTKSIDKAIEMYQKYPPSTDPELVRILQFRC